MSYSSLAVFLDDSLPDLPSNLTSTGAGARPGVISPSVLQFIKLQAPGAKYILSACTGSWILAQAGVLDGKKATSNKSALRELMV